MTSLKDPPQEQGDTPPNLDGTAEPSTVACADTEERAETAATAVAEIADAIPSDTQSLDAASPPALPAQAVPEIPSPAADPAESANDALAFAELPPEPEPAEPDSTDISPSLAPLPDAFPDRDEPAVTRIEGQDIPKPGEDAPSSTQPAALQDQPAPIEPQTTVVAAAATSPPAVLDLPRVIPTDLSLAPSPSTVAPPRFHPSPAPPRAPPAIPAATSPWRTRIRRLAIILLSIGFGYAALVLLLIGAYRFIDPPRSTVMLGIHLSGESVDYRPVAIGNISSYLQRAVVTSEDARFCRHWGVDWAALYEAMQDSRGGSTITMQTAKNLFLWPSRSYIRKAIEIPVALAIDIAWPKRRILEVYLNIAEWGPGIFGAEAAAWYHFNKPASRLTPQEATLLAASLPNPIAREAGDPGRVTALLAARLRGRMANSDAYVGCLGLRQMPRRQQSEPAAPKAAPKPAPKPQQWQTKTEPAKPPAAQPAQQPFNPWQN